ncbi:YhcN/YlaJ family sporulation lipoprotein [Paenibacillus sp. ACRRX]|uniref:YhcN/YlaJ family sporulation lipoprotein n=1 Tax=unclassified Paenibacillus TaxID=185978 RepID=UPI001EF64E88|nr:MULTISPECIES: YhcN/YlaJ family sporulation lipoprotein [unclassified Paenibacillus]MCG7407818.1 YhcN/YlaJ family sporulation lipoprotein [Paenibacillus sp. ACRRX]MDK8180961.1 YhcN/YlaJ family sporulation lipoprotein [Paenibacillus sp. UMB4589-SE434]
MRRTLIAVVMLCVFIAGCDTLKKQSVGDAHSYTTDSSVQMRSNMRQQASAKEPIRDREAVKQHLVELAQRVPGVKHVNCVVLGNTAVVGIDVDSKLDRSRVGTIKYSVAEALSKDKYGVNAYVTADIDLNQRIQEMSTDIKRGRPIAGITEELSDIIGRMVPQIPKDVKNMKADAETSIPKAKSRSNPTTKSSHDHAN